MGLTDFGRKALREFFDDDFTYESAIELLDLSSSEAYTEAARLWDEWEEKKYG